MKGTLDESGLGRLVPIGKSPINAMEKKRLRAEKRRQQKMDFGPRSGAERYGYIPQGQNKTGPSIMDSPVKKERWLCKVGYFVLLAN